MPCHYQVYSKELRVDGGKRLFTVAVWNPTVANLTLMALGSSAPEILLSTIEICTSNFYAGELGPGTIVGSAAYNMLVISAVCIMAIPAGAGMHGDPRAWPHARRPMHTAARIRCLRAVRLLWLARAPRFLRCRDSSFHHCAPLPDATPPPYALSSRVRTHYQGTLRLRHHRQLLDPRLHLAHRTPSRAHRRPAYPIAALPIPSPPSLSHQPPSPRSLAHRRPLDDGMMTARAPHASIGAPPA